MTMNALLAHRYVTRERREAGRSVLSGCDACLRDTLRLGSLQKAEDECRVSI